MVATAKATVTKSDLVKSIDRSIWAYVLYLMKFGDARGCYVNGRFFESSIDHTLQDKK